MTKDEANRTVSKSEAISAMDELLTFSSRAALAFSALHYRVQSLRERIVRDSHDPIQEYLIEETKTMSDEWEKTAKDLSA